MQLENRHNKVKIEQKKRNGGIDLKSISVVKVGSLRDPDESKRGKVAVLDIPEQEVGPEDV